MRGKRKGTGNGYPGEKTWENILGEGGNQGEGEKTRQKKARAGV